MTLKEGKIDLNNLQKSPMLMQLMINGGGAADVVSVGSRNSSAPKPSLSKQRRSDSRLSQQSIKSRVSSC